MSESILPKGDFFVMMYNQKSTTAYPILDEDDNVAFWKTEEKAHEDMKDHPYASVFGYKVFEMGTGSSW